MASRSFSEFTGVHMLFEPPTPAIRRCVAELVATGDHGELTVRQIREQLRERLGALPGSDYSKQWLSAEVDALLAQHRERSTHRHRRRAQLGDDRFAEERELRRLESGGAPSAAVVDPSDVDAVLAFYAKRGAAKPRKRRVSDRNAAGLEHMVIMAMGALDAAAANGSRAARVSAAVGRQFPQITSLLLDDWKVQVHRVLKLRTDLFRRKVLAPGSSADGARATARTVLYRLKRGVAAAGGAGGAQSSILP